jgi:hypothetical protein
VNTNKAGRKLAILYLQMRGRCRRWQSSPSPRKGRVVSLLLITVTITAALLLLSPSVCDAQRYRSSGNSSNDGRAFQRGTDDYNNVNDDDTTNEKQSQPNNANANANNIVLDLKRQGWQLVAHRSKFSADELVGKSPSHRVDALLPSTSFGDFTNVRVCQPYERGDGDSSSSSPPSLPLGAQGSFERPFRNVEEASEIMFRTGGVTNTAGYANEDSQTMYAVADYASLHEALTNDVVDLQGGSRSNGSTSGTSAFSSAIVEPDGTIISQLDFWFYDSRGRMHYTPGHVHNRRSLHLIASETNDDKVMPMGPLITIDARHVGGVGSIVLLWGDTRDLNNDAQARESMLKPYGILTYGDDNIAPQEDDHYAADVSAVLPEAQDLLLLSETHEGVNVLVRGTPRDSDGYHADAGFLHRNPLQERGWELVAHVSNRGVARTSFFGGNAALKPDYSYNVQHATWAPHPTTPDFALPFPTKSQVCPADRTTNRGGDRTSDQDEDASVVRDDQEEEADDEWELMFVTGDSSLWVLVEDYTDLRDIIDAKEAEYLPNFDFIVGYPDEGLVQTSRGNVLSKPPQESSERGSSFADGSPWISFEGSHMYGVRHGRMIWGEDDETQQDSLTSGANPASTVARTDGSSLQRNGYTSLKTKLGGINVYVRRKALREQEQESSTAGGGYYYGSERDADEDYQAFFPCQKNHAVYDENDRSGPGGNSSTIIDNPFLPDGRPSIEGDPTSSPTFPPALELADDADANGGESNGGRFNDGIVVLIPDAPTSTPTEEGATFPVDQGGLSDGGETATDDPDSDRSYRAKIFGGAAASAVILGMLLGCGFYIMQRKCFVRRHPGGRHGWGRKVEDAAGAAVTQSKRYVDIFGVDVIDDDEKNGVGIKS